MSEDTVSPRALIRDALAIVRADPTLETGTPDELHVEVVRYLRRTWPDLALGNIRGLVQMVSREDAP
jgi:hypothetical protein